MSAKGQHQFLKQTDVLRGEAVTVRLPRLEEVSFVRALWADPETMAPVGGPHLLAEEETEGWYARMVNPGDSTGCCCLIFNQEDIPVGEVSFHGWVQQERSARLNIKVLAAHRGHGYGKDALRTFLTFFFGSVGGRVITDNVGLENQGGQRLLRSTGFEQDTGFSDVCMLIMTNEMHTARSEKLDQG